MSRIAHTFAKQQAEMVTAYFEEKLVELKGIREKRAKKVKDKITVQIQKFKFLHWKSWWRVYRGILRAAVPDLICTDIIRPSTLQRDVVEPAPIEKFRSTREQPKRT